MFDRLNSALLPAIVAAGALMVPHSALAIIPRAEPPSYSAYGPLQLCTDRFVIDVSEGEALHVVGDITRIISDRELLAIKSGNAPEDLPASPMDNVSNPSTSASVQTGWSNLHTRRFNGATPDAGQTIRYAAHGLRDEDVRYAISPVGEPNDTLIIGATSFDGSENDRRLLSRVKPVSAKSPDCLPLSALFNGDLGDDDAKRAYDLANFRAHIYPPSPDPGPLYHCFSGIGFALEPGETLLRPWYPLGEAGEFHIGTGGSNIAVERRFYGEDVLRPGDSANFAEHPMGLLRKSEITYYPSRGSGPPYAAPGEREPGSWAVKLIESNDYGITFRFPASEHTAAGFHFLERLQFVKDTDPRCAKK